MSEIISCECTPDGSAYGWCGVCLRILTEKFRQAISEDEYDKEYKPGIQEEKNSVTPCENESTSYTTSIISTSWDDLDNRTQDIFSTHGIIY